LCPRLVAYRAANAQAEPLWFNGAAPSFGDPGAWLLIVGLAPGRTGANRTGRPFTGDHAGGLLFSTLTAFGLAQGVYDARPDDGLTLKGAMITNAVRCAPPQNKPTPGEIATCNGFLAARLAALANLKAIVCLGKVSHDATLRALGARPARHLFAHAARHVVEAAGGPVTLFDSYHCSRYNTQTRRLTEAMFHDVFAMACALRP
jgi:uracil-DNA glycosylase family 4